MWTFLRDGETMMEQSLLWGKEKMVVALEGLSGLDEVRVEANGLSTLILFKTPIISHQPCDGHGWWVHCSTPPPLLSLG